MKAITNNELVQGILGLMSAVKCRKHICHLYKVLPQVIELGGAATGY